MSNYQYPNQLKAIWDGAIRKYQEGGRDPKAFFDDKEIEYLRSIGLIPTDIFDSVEDHCDGGEPTWESFLLIHSVRRAYFLNVQDGQSTGKIIDKSSLPPKEEKVRDVAWLPRIIAKAKAKLHGELPTTIMYGCSGDRRFLKSRNIHPADFLQAIWRFEGNDQALIDWVLAQKS